MNPINDPLNFGKDYRKTQSGENSGDINYPCPKTKEPVTDGGVQTENTPQTPSVEENLTPEEVTIGDLLEMLPEEEKALQNKEGYTPRGLMKAAENALDHSFYTADQTISGTNYSIRQLAKDSSAERAHNALEKLQGKYLDQFDLKVNREGTEIKMSFYRPREL